MCHTFVTERKQAVPPGREARADWSPIAGLDAVIKARPATGLALPVARALHSLQGEFLPRIFPACAWVENKNRRWEDARDYAKAVGPVFNQLVHLP